MKRIWTHYVVAALVLAAGATTVYALTRFFGVSGRVPPLAGPLSSFDKKVAGWGAGKEGVMGPEVREILDPIESLDREYVKELSDGRKVSLSFFVGYFDRPAKALKHPPSICLPSQGWKMVEAGEVVVDASSGFTVEKLLFRREERNEYLLVLYWIDSPGGTGTSSTWIKLVNSFTEFERLFKSEGGSWGAKLMISARIKGSADKKAAAAVQEFAAEAQRILERDFFPAPGAR
jgi:EpsI family protein